MESLSWQDFGFSEETTGDGSPTLRLTKTIFGEKPPESMHHSGGAAAETEQIYGPIAKHLFNRAFCQQGFSSRFLSVGLGLGYIEMMLAREALFAPKTPLDFLLSFESEPDLRRFFLDWVFDREIPQSCQTTYDRVAHFVLKESPWTSAQIKKQLQLWYTQKHWQLEGRLETQVVTQVETQAEPYIQIAEATAQGRFSGIFYDAFSAKTSEGLWSEVFLVKFLERFADKSCLLSTYACLGPLKRALKRQNFEMIKRDGFCGKRNSTFAYRGILQSPL